jgi:hypothetical protein
MLPKEAAEGPEDIVSRERYQADTYQQRLMRDVVSAEIGITRESFERAEPLFRAAGFQITTQSTGALLDGEEGDLVIQFVPKESTGLRSVAFVLNRQVTPEQHQIGNSTLSVGPGDRARWTFTLGGHPKPAINRHLKTGN